ncbi:MAG: hypothetical protein ACUVX1_03795, partial [Chloroflexota bacterium]
METAARSAMSLLMAVAIAFLSISCRPVSAEPPAPTVDITQVVEKAKAGQVVKIILQEDGNTLTAEYRDGTQVRSRKEPNASMLEYLSRAGVSPDSMPAIEVQSTGSDSLGGFGSFGFFLPMLMFGGLFMILMLFMGMRRRSAGPGDDKTMSFSKSRARVFIGTRPN